MNSFLLFPGSIINTWQSRRTSRKKTITNSLLACRESTRPVGKDSPYRGSFPSSTAVHGGPVDAAEFFRVQVAAESSGWTFWASGVWAASASKSVPVSTGDTATTRRNGRSVQGAYGQVRHRKEERAVCFCHRTYFLYPRARAAPVAIPRHIGPIP